MVLIFTLIKKKYIDLSLCAGTNLLGHSPQIFKKTLAKIPKKIFQILQLKIYMLINIQILLKEYFQITLNLYFVILVLKQSLNLLE